MHAAGEIRSGMPAPAGSRQSMQLLAFQQPPRLNEFWLARLRHDKPGLQKEMLRCTTTLWAVTQTLSWQMGFDDGSGMHKTLPIQASQNPEPAQPVQTLRHAYDHNDWVAVGDSPQGRQECPCGDRGRQGGSPAAGLSTGQSPRSSAGPLLALPPPAHPPHRWAPPPETCPQELHHYCTCQKGKGRAEDAGQHGFKNLRGAGCVCAWDLLLMQRPVRNSH